MAHDFIPRPDVKFLDWSRSFSARINATPEDFGLSVEQAVAYSVLHSAFDVAYRAVRQPSTRTSLTVLAKKEARRAAEREARRLARLIHATPGITNTQRHKLGLTVRDGEPSPIPRPADPPRLFVKLLRGATVRIRLRGVDSLRRGKPAGVAGASVFSHVGERPPDSLSKWTYEGDTTRPQMDVTLPPSTAPGATVWLTAYWYNPRAQRGPACVPQYTHIQCPTPRLGKMQRQAA